MKHIVHISKRFVRQQFYNIYRRGTLADRAKSRISLQPRAIIHGNRKIVAKIKNLKMSWRQTGLLSVVFCFLECGKTFLPLYRLDEKQW